MIEKAKLVWEFNKKITQTSQNTEITLYITNGLLENTKDLLFSIDNLLSYKWFILPKNVFIYQWDPLENINYFKTNTWYDLKKLENLARNTIFTNLKEIDNYIPQNTLLPINETIEQTFYTSCIKQNKIFNTTCNFYITNFLKSFFIYNIDEDIKELNELFTILKNSKYKWEFCDGLHKHVMYSNKTNIYFDEIFQECWQEYYEAYNDFWNFLKIQEQLNKWYIDHHIYNNKNLNAYKLISYQQILYNSLINNNIDKIQFESYFNYFKSILQESNKIENIYLDLSYWFHQNYIIQKLNKIKYNVGNQKKSDIENISKNINTIHNWSPLEWFIGLKILLTNTQLKEFKVNDELELDENINVNNLMDNIRTLSFLKILNESIGDEQIKISGYFTLRLKSEIFPLYLGFVVDKQWIIQNINISEYQDLNNTVESIIKQKSHTISEIYQYIQNNIGIFLSQDIISTCDLIQNKLEIYQKQNKEISLLNLVKCDSDLIKITKVEKIANQINHTTHYEISLDNFDITNIRISDKNIESEVKKYLDKISTNHITIWNIVQEIINYKINIDQKKEGNSNFILAIEEFERFLSISPNDIYQIDQDIIIEFKIDGISFVWYYDLINKSLWPLYFKFIANSNDDTNDEIDLFIDNFNILLSEENQNEINRFHTDPLKYIQNINPQSVDNYMEILKE